MELDQIVQPMNDVPGISMTPQEHRRLSYGRYKPPKQLSVIGSLKCHILERKASDLRPVALDPWRGMIDEDLIERIVDAHREQVEP